MNCRFCNGQKLIDYINIGHSPVANNLLKSEDLDKKEIYYPLKVFVCTNCFLVQTKDYNASHEIFTNQYPYFSSVSKTWLKHAQSYTEMMIDRFKLDVSARVVEIASNDGYLLQYFREKGFNVQGVEPTANTAEVAQNKGIPTFVNFFGEKFAKEKFDKKKADLLIGNNVVAHVPDINDFIKGMKFALSPNGIITLEFPHLLKLNEENQFDTVYHEHYSYFSFYTINKIFNTYDLELFDVEEISTHGGSLRIFAKHKKDTTKPITENVERLLSKEKKSGINSVEFYSGMNNRMKQVKFDLLEFLIQAKKKGDMVVAYGAAAKGNTLLNYCGVDSDLVVRCFDANPHKQGKYLPGSHIFIDNPDNIEKYRPDYVLILPWNIKHEVIEQFKESYSLNTTFVTAIPELQFFSS